MKFVLVDTSVWSMAFRKKELTHDEIKLLNFLTKLIRNQRVIMIGAIRQEILCGISDKNKFNLLKENLDSFPDFEINTEDYVTAAEFYNLCRSKGIQGSATDFLICSVAKNHNFSILTLDKDFENFKKIIKLNLISI